MTTAEQVRRIPAGITIYSVEAGDRVLLRTLDEAEARRSAQAHDMANRDIEPEANIVQEVYPVEALSKPKYAVVDAQGIARLRSPSTSVVCAYVDGWIQAGGDAEGMRIQPCWLDEHQRANR